MTQKTALTPELFNFLGGLPPDTLIAVAAVAGIVLIATLSILKGAK